MLKEIFYLLLIISIFLLIGVIVSITDIDYTVAKYYSENNKTNKLTYPKKNEKKSNREPSGIKVEIVNASGSKFIFVDKGTTQLEVFAIMGGKVKNILTITNLLKIITNGDSKIDMR